MKTRSFLLAVLGMTNLTWGAGVEPQPFLAAVQRIIEATSFLGTPFSDDEIAR
jgi:hypothetical protein